MPADTIELLARLVEFDSVNPALVPGGAGENAIAAFVVASAADNAPEAEVLEAFEIAPDAPLVRLVTDAVTDVLGTPPASEGAGYWADAAFIAAAGIPTVIYGPSGQGAHAAEEWVSVSDTERVTRVLLGVARRVCG